MLFMPLFFIMLAYAAVIAIIGWCIMCFIVKHWSSERTEDLEKK